MLSEFAATCRRVDAWGWAKKPGVGGQSPSVCAQKNVKICWPSCRVILGPPLVRIAGLEFNVIQSRGSREFEVVNSEIELEPLF
jgi:hypothetical protein